MYFYKSENFLLNFGLAIYTPGFENRIKGMVMGHEPPMGLLFVNTPSTLPFVGLRSDVEDATFIVYSEESGSLHNSIKR